MCPRRRLISLSPRHLLTWQCRRFSTVSAPHPWTLPCRRSHTVLFLRMFLRRWELALLPRSLLMCLFRLLNAAMCYTMLPHNYRSLSSLLDVSTRTIPWTAKTSFVSPPPSVQGPRALLQPPPGLEQPAPPSGPAIGSHLYTTHGASTTAAPLRARLRSAISVSPPQPPACTTHVGTHPVRSATSAKRSASTALAGTHNPVGSDPRTGTGPFPKPRALVLPMVKFGQPKSDRLGHIDTVDSDLMHHQFRLSLLQWNPGPARRNPTNIVSAACGKFHAVILQEAVITFRTSLISLWRSLATRTSLSCSTRIPLSLTRIVLTFKADSTSKGTWGMVLLIVRGLLRRPSLSGSPTVTFCSVHIQNVVAKKRDASTELLQFLHAKMREHNVDFIGGDFYMSAFSMVGDVFSDPEFSAPGHSCLW